MSVVFFNPSRSLRALLLLFFVAFAAKAQFQTPNSMKAHFIDVGQADATLLEFPCGAILIDAGAQDVFYQKKLTDYLDKFFARRTDLHRTIDLVLVTHAHIDHNYALAAIVKNYKVKRYVDNSLRVGSGRKNQKWLQDSSARFHMTYAGYSFDRIRDNHLVSGYTDTILDPLNCAGIDPKIILLSGSFKKKPYGWTNKDFADNGNNHSLVVKVIFGTASFLFTGDQETAAMRDMVAFFKNGSMLDADVLRVGHHGAANATSKDFLEAVSPKYAVISCGRWDFGLKPKEKTNYNTYNYGHPREVCIDMLLPLIPGFRTQDTVKVATGVRKFVSRVIDKDLYATAWDKNICIEASREGIYRVSRLQ